MIRRRPSIDKFFEELNAAIDVLTTNRSVTIASSADNIYGGSAEKWCKFANSLKLRLAMRIVYADPATARTMAESAVSHEIGVMTSNDDNARLTSFGANGNPIYVAVNYNSATHSDNSACLTGGDSHAAADIICYMNAYNDPRRAAYFVESEWPGQTYVGMRRGIEIPDLSSIGHKYSGVKLTTSSPLYWMNAAEVAFLKAEAKAIFGFDMGSGSAEDFYNEGIRLSFEQWGVSGYESYIAQNSAPQIVYVDPNNGKDTYSSTLSTASVAWKNGTLDEMQERIIIQKWNCQLAAGQRVVGRLPPHGLPAPDSCHGRRKQERRHRRFRDGRTPHALSGRGAHDQCGELPDGRLHAAAGNRQHGYAHVVGLQPEHSPQLIHP